MATFQARQAREKMELSADAIKREYEEKESTSGEGGE